MKYLTNLLPVQCVTYTKFFCRWAHLYSEQIVNVAYKHPLDLLSAKPTLLRNHQNENSAPTYPVKKKFAFITKMYSTPR